jgi:two-component system chemotaxis sensor kinase CheA
MDELLRDFLTETAELIDGIGSQLVAFEQNPADPKPITSIFRLVHTIKGTASFLGLDRLQRVTHSAETLLGLMRDGVPPTEYAVSLILSSMDRIKAIIDEVEANGAEIAGDDTDITGAIDTLCENGLQTSPPVVTALSSAPREAIVDEPAFGPAPAAATEMPSSAPSHPTVEAHGANGQKPAKGPGAGAAPETIRVNVATIERIMELVSELVLTRNQLLELTRYREGDAVKTPLQRLSALTTDLQDAVMRARMQPVGRLFASLPRLVRELSVELGKKIELVTEGADTELDRQLIEVIRDPLTHLIRNCADHGIEAPDVRRSRGKPETGLVRVAAFHEAGQITIEVADDGNGLDAAKIRAKCVRLGLLAETDAATLSENEVYRFIFEPGFSTAQSVTTVSGRGVGMDVVRSNIESIGGSISLSSEPGRGSRFSLRIPLTLAIAPALIVEASGQRFALPQNAVVEAVALGEESRHQIERVQNALVLRLREEVIPVVSLRTVLDLDGEGGNAAAGLVVILRVGANSFGVIVDAVSDVQEIVVKPLSASLAHLNVFSGHTILGDGSVVLILDPSGLAQGLNVEKSSERDNDSAGEAASAREATLLLQFRAGYGATKVIPLAFVSRIITVESSSISTADGRLVLLYQDRLMPVIAVGGSANLDRRLCPVLIVTVAETSFGLLVDEVLDIIEERLDIELVGEGAEVVGSAKLKGQAVEFVDVTSFLKNAFPERFQGDQAAGSILLIGDELVTRAVIEPSVAAAGYSVTAVRSAIEACALIESGTSADAVLIDNETMSADLDDLMRALSSLHRTVPLIGLVRDEMTFGTSPQSSHFAAAADKFDRRSILRTLADVMRSVHREDAAAASAAKTNRGIAA